MPPTHVRFALLFILFLAFTLQTSVAQKRDKNKTPVQQIYSEEFIVPKLGIKVQDMRNIAYEDGPAYITSNSPRVTAVLEHGAAYYAGLAPGDELAFVNRRGSFTSKELAEGIPKITTRDVAITLQYKTVGWDRPYYSTKIDVRLLGNEPRDGRWITEIPIHKFPNRAKLTGLAEAQAQVQTKYDELYNRQVLSITGTPCQYGAGSGALESIANDLLTWKRRGASKAADYEPTLQFLGDLWNVSCDNLKEGELPALERALWAMTFDETLDACAYSESYDYRSVFIRPENLRYYSKSKYRAHYFERVNAYVKRISPAQKACLIGLLKITITKREKN